MSDCEVSGIDQFDDPLIYFSIFSNYGPMFFEYVIKERKWQKTIDYEMNAIEKNNIWELIELPKTQEIIGVKWT